MIYGLLSGIYQLVLHHGQTSLGQTRLSILVSQQLGNKDPRVRAAALDLLASLERKIGNDQFWSGLGNE
ncbi:unnamed protein product [Protopolystoma xenopodis]|uniref:HEAT repeat domain-containing protein n=1 Tax=Protopolystoma xenopodis TaxID=117903 RepID=A0A448X939_9PLAT|nr:unnamed protein product [Protopolystoma xenopodis]